MAFAKTMSNNPTDHWNIQSYQTNQTPPETTTPTNSATTSRNNSNNNNNLIPDQGRVSKPIRRRSRASRRTPTTLLSTDATNFRAMVQHFTGGPALQQQIPTGPPFLDGGGVGNFNFTQHVGATGGGSGFQMQYPNQAMQEHMFMINNMGGGGGGRGGGVPPHLPTGNENRNLDNYML